MRNVTAWEPHSCWLRILKGERKTRSKHQEQERKRHDEHRSVPESASHLLSAIRVCAPRRGCRHSAGAVFGNVLDSTPLSAAEGAGDFLRMLLLGRDYIDSRCD